jgi:hypothetical protein
MSTEILFVGYLTLEEWLRVVDKQRPVYALLFTEVGETSYDLRTDSMVIEVAQPEDGQALVHYARLHAGSLRYQGGEPFDRDHKERVEKAEELWGKVESWLEGQGLAVRHGRVAMPAGITKVRSGAGFVG